MDIRLADVSEFQTVDWPAYSEPAVIIRALYGTSHVDNHWAANIAGARANPGIRVRGIYHYIVAPQDITAQALAFVRTVGALRPGEFVIADVEEGAGDLQARFEAWAQVVHAGLGGLEAEYSGSAFAAAHLEGFAGARFAWVAAYQAAEPGLAHQLWQYSDRQVFAGISAPCDASVFHGSIDQLYALVAGGPPAPARPTTAQRGDLVMLSQADSKLAIAEIERPQGGRWIVFQDGGVQAREGAPYYGSYPGLPVPERQGVGVFTDAVFRGPDGYSLVRQDGCTYDFGADLFGAYKADGGQ